MNMADEQSCKTEVTFAVLNIRSLKKSLKICNIYYGLYRNIYMKQHNAGAKSSDFSLTVVTNEFCIHEC